MATNPDIVANSDKATTIVLSSIDVLRGIDFLINSKEPMACDWYVEDGKAVGECRVATDEDKSACSITAQDKSGFKGINFRPGPWKMHLKYSWCDATKRMMIVATDVKR